MRFFLVIFIFFGTLFAKEFKVASYNVENLFDLSYDGTEYKEYNPRSKSWNEKKYTKKLSNILQVITDLDAHILAVQEIESKKAFDSLKMGSNYPYGQFLKNRNSAIGLGILSSYPIVKHKSIIVDRYDKYTRPILKVTLDIKGDSLIVYINHWRSKRAAESKRIPYALALKKDIDTLSQNQDYIILGDLNSNYNEFQTFKFDRKFNDTHGITGINQILNTTEDKNLVNETTLLNSNKSLHYNLWLELQKNSRFSTKFRNDLGTPDNMILPKSMYDSYGISYLDNSFKVFKPSYLYKNNYIQRWNHKKAKGYSDHLPIYATFYTGEQKNSFLKEKETISKNKISYLYEIESLNNPVDLYDCVVIYKSKKTTVVKQKYDRAIIIYKPSFDLKLGYSYTLTASQIDTYNGNKEITQLSFKANEKKVKDLDSYYKKDTIELLEEKNQNEIIKDITGIYKKGHFFTNDTKIKIYFKKGIQRPKNNTKLHINYGHLNSFKNKKQITLYSQKDFSILD